jgi:adenosine deaminase CECR1
MLRLLPLVLCSCFLFPCAAADFSARFAEITRTATAPQLYALLYDLPKGGDLHNHSAGSDLP